MRVLNFFLIIFQDRLVALKNVQGVEIGTLQKKIMSVEIAKSPARTMSPKEWNALHTADTQADNDDLDQENFDRKSTVPKPERPWKARESETGHSFKSEKHESRGFGGGNSTERSKGFSRSDSGDRSKGYRGGPGAEGRRDGSKGFRAKEESTDRPQFRRGDSGDFRMGSSFRKSNQEERYKPDFKKREYTTDRVSQGAERRGGFREEKSRETDDRKAYGRRNLDSKDFEERKTKSLNRRSFSADGQSQNSRSYSKDETTAFHSQESRRNKPEKRADNEDAFGLKTTTYPKSSSTYPKKSFKPPKRNTKK